MIFIQIAIDGPAGAGKSTIAKILAERLGYIYIDTGAMYRAITLAALRQGILFSDKASLARLAGESKIELLHGKAGSQEVFLNSQLVNEEIRTPLINQKVSLVAKIPEVREVLVYKQREMAENNNVVMDGRDIGTVVLPSAELKIFLTATLDERAKRRYYELLGQGYAGTLAEVKHELEKRDQLDSSRDISPLCVAADAITIDTTDKTLENIAEIIIKLMAGRAKETKHEIL